jgi:glutaredoxin-related protein
MTYKEKLLDPRWQKKRLKILERDGFRCQLCQDPSSTLHVHHEKYSGEPWEVDNIYLITYCKHCHPVVEIIEKQYSNYEIIDAWKGDHSSTKNIILFVTLAHRPKSESVRMILMFKFENESPILVMDIKPYEAHVLYNMAINGTYSVETPSSHK